MENAEGPHLTELGLAAQGASGAKRDPPARIHCFNAAEVSNNHLQI